MPADARVSAWISSWKHLEGAKQLLEKDPNHPAVGAFHDALVERADIYARLASASDEIGVAAGEYLQKEYQQGQDRKAEDRRKMEGVLGHR